jgi:hypothetical protein
MVAFRRGYYFRTCFRFSSETCDRKEAPGTGSIIM